MSINQNYCFNKYYLVGDYLKRQGRIRRHPLLQLGISEEEVANLRKFRGDPTKCADLIGNLAKDTFVRDLEEFPDLDPISLAERIKYITAHVYNGSTFLRDHEETLLTNALNKAISAHTETLIQELCSRKSPNGNASLKNRIQNTKQVATKYHQFICAQRDKCSASSQDENSGLNPLKQLASRWRQAGTRPAIEKLQAAHHTYGILTSVLENLSPHHIRTKATSHFQVILQPKNDRVGKDYDGLSVSFLPTNAQETASPELNCFLAKDNSSGASIPIEIQIGNHQTKWIFITIESDQIPPTVRKWLQTNEGLAAIEQAKNTNWSYVDDCAEALYRHATTSSTDTVKTHTLSGLHVYVSSKGVLFGRKHENLSGKYSRFIAKGGFNAVYQAHTLNLTGTQPSLEEHIVRKAHKGKEKTAQGLSYQKELYTRLQGCPNIAIPQMVSYETMGKKKTKMLEIMPIYNQGSLDRFTPTNNSQKTDLCLQASRGVAAMHQKGIWHGDLKPANMLAHQEDKGPLQVFISDVDDTAFFGDAAEACTFEYLAPECRRGAPTRTKQQAIARDSWALGMSLYQIVHGAAVPNSDPSSQFSLEARDPHSKNATSQEKRDYVISRLLDPDAATRMTAEEAHQAFDAISDFESL